MKAHTWDIHGRTLNFLFLLFLLLGMLVNSVRYEVIFIKMYYPISVGTQLTIYSSTALSVKHCYIIPTPQNWRLWHYRTFLITHFMFGHSKNPVIIQYYVMNGDILPDHLMMVYVTIVSKERFYQEWSVAWRNFVYKKINVCTLLDATGLLDMMQLHALTTTCCSGVFKSKVCLIFVGWKGNLKPSLCWWDIP